MFISLIQFHWLKCLFYANTMWFLWLYFCSITWSQGWRCFQQFFHCSRWFWLSWVLAFPYKVENCLCITVENCVWILVGIAVNLWLAFGRMAILWWSYLSMNMGSRKKNIFFSKSMRTRALTPPHIHTYEAGHVCTCFQPLHSGGRWVETGRYLELTG